MAKKKQPHTDRQASVVAHSLRCGVKTRKGTPCKLPAKQNGRCWIHGKKKAESSTEKFDQSAEIIPEYQIEPESTDEQQKSVEELTEAGDLDLEREKDAEIDAGSAEAEPTIELDADAIEILEVDIQPETEEPPDSEETDDTGLEDLQLELLDDTVPGSDSIEIEPVIELDADSLEISTDVIQPELEEASEPEEILDTETNELKLELETEPDADSEAVIDAYDDAIISSEAKLQVEAEEPPISEDDLNEEIEEACLILDQELGADTGTEEVLDEQEPEPETAGLKLEEGYAGKPAEGQVAKEEWDDFTQTVEIEPPKAKPKLIETEKSQKPAVGLIKKAFAVSGKLKQLRKKRFTVSVLSMILTGLVVCIVFGAYAFNRLEPKIQDEGNLRITAMDIQSKVVNNFRTPDLA